MQDNDPKHTLATARRVFSEKGFNSGNHLMSHLMPNDPIKNLWHELKEYIRQEIKASTKVELITGIEKFGTLLV